MKEKRAGRGTTGLPGGLSFLIGNEDTVAGMPRLPALAPFDIGVLDMLNDVSRILMADREIRNYPDVATFAFWIRKSSTVKRKERFHREDGNIRLGRGTAFHIAPSNVPVNFAYSLAAGLLTGNANIVRLPSKEFPQVEIIVGAFKKALSDERNRKLSGYLCLVRYGREKEINDCFSAIADMRIIWGGDETIAEIRSSPLAPRAGEVTFADRFSVTVIDSSAYMSIRDKSRVAEKFYNDTYLTDQNACTSPRMVVWLGSRRKEAKETFWGTLHGLVEQKYNFQPIMGIDKLTGSCLAAVTYGAERKGSADMFLMPDHGYGMKDGESGVTVEPHTDNLLVRVKISWIADGLMDLKGNSGYFFEYDCDDILDLKGLCSDCRCQTVSYIGEKEMLGPLLTCGIRGVDRVVPVGKTMDFDLVWDGCDLYERLTRIISIE